MDHLRRSAICFNEGFLVPVNLDCRFGLVAQFKADPPTLHHEGNGHFVILYQKILVCGWLCHGEAELREMSAMQRKQILHERLWGLAAPFLKRDCQEAYSYGSSI